MSAQANGRSSGCFGIGVADPRPGRDRAGRADLDHLGEVLARHRVVLGRRDEHPAVGPLDADEDCPRAARS